MKAIVILLDSLNRHYLSCYGNGWVKTPNIDRLAARSVIFDNHWLGSAPCMPARRDLFTGRLSFLERNWSGLDPHEVTMQQLLRKNGIHSHIETDHQHYWNGGGEFYHTTFDTWNGYRGQEIDPCGGPIAEPTEPDHLGKWHPQYARNRERFKNEEAAFPTPKTFQGAVDWLRVNERADDYLLWVEAFDPHEPFETTDEYLALYGDDWDGPLYDWTGYERVGHHSAQATAHIRKQYAACLTMTDRWLGRLLDEIERQDGYDDTLIVFTTDHGHLLGEHGVTGKNFWPVWNEVAHLPLMIHLPGGACAGERRAQMTQNIDLMPTLLEHFGITVEHPVHGRSFSSCVTDANAPAHRETALYGWFGRTVNLTDGRYTYFRGPGPEGNAPLFHHFVNPTRYHGLLTADHIRRAEFGHFLKGVDCPVLRTPVGMRVDDELRHNRLFDLESDYAQSNDLTGTPVEKEMIGKLTEALRAVDCPDSQYERLGLKS